MPPHSPSPQPEDTPLVRGDRPDSEACLGSTPAPEVEGSVEETARLRRLVVAGIGAVAIGILTLQGLRAIQIQQLEDELRASSSGGVRGAGFTDGVPLEGGGIGPGPLDRTLGVERALESVRTRMAPHPRPPAWTEAGGPADLRRRQESRSP